MRRKKNRVEVWAGRGRHLYIVQAVALTVVPDTALHPPRRRESNMNLGPLLHSLCRQLLTIWHDIETVSPFGFVEVLPFVFMGLGAICVDQATRGIPGPPGHVPVAPFRWLAREAMLKGRRLLPPLIPFVFFWQPIFGVSKLNYQDSSISWLFLLWFFFFAFFVM